MGCDIHGRVQIKRWSEQSDWTDLMEIPRDRNYALFSRLAGVRSCGDDDPVIAQPRGLPGDFDTDMNYDHEIHHGYGDDACIEKYWMGDHSHSWLSLEEMTAWDGWEEPMGRCDSWLKLLDYLKSRGFHDCRVVFGFDS